MKYLALLMLLLLVSCGHKRKVEAVGFESYLVGFQHNAALQGIDINIDDLTIGFDDNMTANSDNGLVVGLCKIYRDSNGSIVETPAITFDTQFWNETSDELRAVLFYHEMGHCVLDQDHRDNDSIMQPTIFEGYYDFFSYYNTELFRFGQDDYDSKLAALAKPSVITSGLRATSGVDIESACGFVSSLGYNRK